MNDTEKTNITRAHLAEAVCKATGLPRTDASAFVELFLGLISETLLRGEPMMISGFGKFVVLKRAARKGRYVKQGTNVMIEPRLAIVFKPAPSLVAHLNGEVPVRRKKVTAAA